MPPGEAIDLRQRIVDGPCIEAAAALEERVLVAEVAMVGATPGDDNRIGAEVELATKVEPEVLGGLRVRMGGRTYDGTVGAQLAALRRSLASGS